MNEARKGLDQRAQMFGEVTMKGAKGFAGVEFVQAREKSAKEAGGDGDVVLCGGRVDWDDGHCVFIVSQVIFEITVILSCRTGPLR